MKHFTYCFFNYQGVCYMTPRHIPTLSSLTQSATLLLQARMLNSIHATYALGTDVASVLGCISVKLLFSPASPHLLPFSTSKKPLWMAFLSFQFTRAHQESSGFYFHNCYMPGRLFNHTSQLPKTISMRYQTSIPESSLFDCRIGLNLCFIMILMNFTPRTDIFISFLLRRYVYYFIDFFLAYIRFNNPPCLVCIRNSQLSWLNLEVRKKADVVWVVRTLDLNWLTPLVHHTRSLQFFLVHCAKP